MLKGFRDFIARGNVIDLAVAVVMGVAFTALVSAFTTAFIKPLIGLVFGGGVRAGVLTIGEQTFDFNLMLNAMITFLITAAVVYFVFVVPMNAYKRRRAKVEEEEKEAKEADTAEEIGLLREIRDELRNRTS
ncbi:MAG: large conductance mechanosensitive channel protein MscL [Candidatus Nanopelagicales bacterium]